MTRRALGGRSLTVVRDRLAAACPVCDDLGRVRIVRLVQQGLRGRGEAACPLCRPEPGCEGLHVRTYSRFRTDVPRDETA